MQRTARSAARGGGRFLHFSPFSPRRGGKTAAEKTNALLRAPVFFADTAAPLSAALSPRRPPPPESAASACRAGGGPQGCIPQGPGRERPAAGCCPQTPPMGSRLCSGGFPCATIKNPRSAAGAANAVLRRPPDQSPARRCRSRAPPRRVAAEKGKGREAQPPPRPLFIFVAAARTFAVSFTAPRPRPQKQSPGARPRPRR